MASIPREVLIECDPDAVWDAVRDVGAVHALTGCRMELAPVIAGMIEQGLAAMKNTLEH